MQREVVPSGYIWSALILKKKILQAVLLVIALIKNVQLSSALQRE